MQPFLEITLTNVVMATGVALIAAVVAKMFRRPVLSHFLWLLVLLKLVTPPLIPVRLSLPAVLEAAFVEMDSAAVSARSRGAEITSMPDIADLPEAWEESNVEWLDPDFVLPELMETNPYRTPATIAKAEIPQPAAARGWNAADNLTWACVAWFGGSVLWLVVAAARVYSFQRLLRHARPAPESLQFQAAILAQRMGLARCRHVTFLSGRGSPL